MGKELFKMESSSWAEAFIAARDRGNRMEQISHDHDHDDGNDDENDNDEILFVHCNHLMANKSMA